MNLDIYFYMSGWWWGDLGSIFTMLHLLRIVSEDFQDRCTLITEPLPKKPDVGFRVSFKKPWLWLQKFG